MEFFSRAVWRHIRSEQANVTNAKEYADIAKLRCPNIQVGYYLRHKISVRPSRGKVANLSVGIHVFG